MAKRFPSELWEKLKGLHCYDLGKEFNKGMTRNFAHPPFLFTLIRAHGDSPIAQKSSAACVFTLGGHTGTHLDAIGHFASEGRIYHYPDDDVTLSESFGRGIMIGGIEETPPIVRRGVLLDIPGLYGKDVLEATKSICGEDLEKATALQKVEVNFGDVVLIRTGWIRNWYETGVYNSTAPGINMDGSLWLADHNIAMVGSDTSAFEKMDETKKNVHVFLLAKRGIQIMETLYLEQLAQDKCYEFLFVGLPLKIKGGTGSPFRPIALC